MIVCDILYPAEKVRVVIIFTVTAVPDKTEIDILSGCGRGQQDRRGGVGASIVPKNWLEAKVLDGADTPGFLTCTLPGAPVTESLIVSDQKEKMPTQEKEIFIFLMMKALG